MPVYDAKAVKAVIGGVMLTGFADGDKVRVQRTNPSASVYVGVDGEGFLNKLNDKRGTITVMTQWGAAVNNVLTGIVESWENLGTPLSASVADLKSGGVFSAAKCAPEKHPDARFGKEGEPLEWTFITPVLEMANSGA